MDQTSSFLARRTALEAQVKALEEQVALLRARLATPIPGRYPALFLALCDAGAFSYDYVAYAEQAGLGPRTALRALRELVQLGLVEEHKDGRTPRFCLSPKGLFFRRTLEAQWT